MTMEITVYGSAKPAGSKKGFVNPRTGRVIITDASKDSRPWKTKVSQVAGHAMAGRGLLDGSLSVVFRFVVARPKGHYKVDGSLSASGRRMPHPAKRPDLLKLARGVEDALTKVVYRDDSQIVDERLVKEWGEPERVEITITELGAEAILEPSLQQSMEF